MNKTTIAAAVIACFPLTASAHAQVVYDNLGAVTSGADNVDSGVNADSFSSGPGGTLTDVQLLVSGGTDGGTYTVNLLSDDGDTPGSVLNVLTTGSNNTLPSAGVLDVPVSIGGLTPDTEYWIQFASSPETSAGWAWSEDVSGPGVAGQFVSYNGETFPNGPTIDDAPYQMAVALNEATIPALSPEPGSLALLATAGVSALGLLRRRRA